MSKVETALSTQTQALPNSDPPNWTLLKDCHVFSKEVYANYEKTTDKDHKLFVLIELRDTDGKFNLRTYIPARREKNDLEVFNLTPDLKLWVIYPSLQYFLHHKSQPQSMHIWGMIPTSIIPLDPRFYNTDA